MHRIIRSQADLAAAHKLILRLLDAVKALKLKVNQAKCAMLVKLMDVRPPVCCKSTRALTSAPLETGSLQILACIPLGSSD